MSALAALALGLSLTTAPARAPVGQPVGCGPDDAWCAAAAARPRLPLASPTDRAALLEVYASPALGRARADPSAVRRLLAALWSRVTDLLGSVEAERYASVGRAIFLAAGLAAALAAWSASRRRGEGAAPSQTDPDTERALLPPPDRSEALAREALARGDPTGTVRHAFLAALSALEGSGLLPRDRTLTNRELSIRLGEASGEVGVEFGALGRSFDRAVYGRLPVAQPEAGEAISRAQRIRAALRGTP